MSQPMRPLLTVGQKENTNTFKTFHLVNTQVALVLTVQWNCGNSGILQQEEIYNYITHTSALCLWHFKFREKKATKSSQDNILYCKTNTSWHFFFFFLDFFELFSIKSHDLQVSFKTSPVSRQVVKPTFCCCSLNLCLSSSVCRAL